MDIEASYLLQQIKDDMRATSARMHKDARRQHALRSASLAIGTGLSAAVVKAKLTEGGLMLRPMKKAPAVYDGYAR